MVSTIIVVKQGEALLASAIESVLAQTRPTDELIVVLGASTDGTERVARSYPGVTLLRQEGEGYADARNVGLRAARGSFIAFLDHDDRWEPCKLERQMAHLTRRQRLGFVTAMMQFHSLSSGERPADGLLPQWMHGPRPGWTPGAMLARRSTFDKVGVFDTTLEIAADTEWFVRTLHAGLAAEMLPVVLLHKYLREDRLSARVAVYRRELLSVVHGSVNRRRGRQGPDLDVGESRDKPASLLSSIDL